MANSTKIIILIFFGLVSTGIMILALSIISENPNNPIPISYVPKQISEDPIVTSIPVLAQTSAAAPAPILSPIQETIPPLPVISKVDLPLIKWTQKKGEQGTLKRIGADHDRKEI